MLSIILIFIGTLALSIGYKALKVHLHNRKLDYILVNGIVVEHEKSTHKTGDKLSIVYTPIFEYYYNGQLHRARHIISSSRFNKNLEVVPGTKYKVGDKVELRVFADSPDYALVNSKTSINFLLYIGIAAIIGGSFALGLYILMTKII